MNRYTFEVCSKDDVLLKLVMLEASPDDAIEFAASLRRVFGHLGTQVAVRRGQQILFSLGMNAMQIMQKEAENAFS